MPRSKKQPPQRGPRERGEDPADKQLLLGGEEWSVGDLSAKVRKELALMGDETPAYTERKGTAPIESRQRGDDEADDAAPEWGAYDDDDNSESDLVGQADEMPASEAPAIWVEPVAPKGRNKRSSASRSETRSDSDAVADNVVVAAATDDDVPDFAAIPEPELDVAIPVAAKPRRVKSPPRRPPPPPRLDLGGWLTFAAVVLVGYVALTAVMLTRPALATRILGSLAPFANFSDAALTARAIGLSELKGDYQMIRGAPAFVVSGVATSAAKGPVRDVRVRGRLYGVSGRVLVEKEIYAGIAISPEVLATTDAFGITVLERLQPTARFSLAPGTGVPFVLVYVKPPTDEPITHFTVEVTAANPVRGDVPRSGVRLNPS